MADISALSLASFKIININGVMKMYQFISEERGAMFQGQHKNSRAAPTTTATLTLTAQLAARLLTPSLRRGGVACSCCIDQ